MRGLGDADLGGPVEEPLNDDPCLGPRQRRSRARVDAVPERDVLANVGPVDAQFVRALELARITAGRPVEQHDRRARGNVDSGRQVVLSDPDQYPLIFRPVDKEENYIKRCVAIAGDTLQIRNQVIYINSQAQPFPPESETNYTVTTKGQPLDESIMKEDYDVDMNPDAKEVYNVGPPNQYDMLLTWRAKEKMQQSGLAQSIVADIDSDKKVFPYSDTYNWSKDNYGPLWIPAKGATLTLTPLNYPLYERAIRVYEQNKFEMRDGKFYLNDQPVTQYTFKMNYYWMMGDNRHGSQDSRYWGFVPEDHIVGEAALIWMSWNKGVRWSRLFKKIR